MTKNIVQNKKLMGLLLLLAVAFIMGAVTGCGSDTSTTTMMKEDGSTGGSTGVAGSSGAAGAAGNSGVAGAETAGAGGTNQMSGNAGTGGTSDPPETNDASGSAGSMDGGKSDGGTAGTDGGTTGSDAVNGTGGTGGSVEPACQGKADFDPCTTATYLGGATDGTGSTISAQPTNRKINLQGKCYKGVCCSGCITADGSCSPVSPLSAGLITPQTQVNNCGVNAAMCFNCNSRENMRACTYTVVQTMPYASNTFVIGDGTCR